MLQKHLCIGLIGAVFALCWVAMAAYAQTTSSLSTPRPSDAAHDACPTPRVDIFDLQLPPRPKEVGNTNMFWKSTDWIVLTTATDGVNEALINRDPSRPLIEYLDLTVVKAAEHAVHNYVPGLDFAPTGPVHGVDYLVEGKISGQEGAYTISVSLEDAKTRVHIADGTATFTKADDSMAAAQKAASHLVPVYDKIRAYQEKLKQSNTSHT